MAQSAQTSLVFGLSRGEPDPKEKQKNEIPSFAPPVSDDGSVPIGVIGGSLQNVHVLSMEAGVQSEAELVERYRTMALYPETDRAIEEITNEAIVQDQTDPIVQLDLDKAENISEQMKDRLQEEFEEVLDLLDFEFKGHEIFKSWYVDSRKAFHKVVDKTKPKDGILELRLLDPRKLKRVKIVNTATEGDFNLYTVVDDYYVYIDSATTYNQTFGASPFGDATYTSGSVPKFQNAVRIEKEAIAFCHSGLVDGVTGTVYGYLHKAIKTFNQLRMMEDALVVYRIARAPERRVFYIDTGGIPPSKQEYYVNRIKNNYRSKMTYDARTGEIADQRRAVSMLEDFWIPRNGNSGTQIDTLRGGDNLSSLDDVVYFKEKFWGTLNVPISRMTNEGSGALFGDDGVISREEMKFTKFINKLRRQFSRLFIDILGTQLILKNIFTKDEWEEIKTDIRFKFATDEHWTEIREADVMNRRLGALTNIQSHIGKNVSREWALKNILKFTDDEIKKEDEKIAQEIASGKVLDPKAELGLEAEAHE